MSGSLTWNNCIPRRSTWASSDAGRCWRASTWGAWLPVTGTNGKGSTCAFVAALLRAQGLKVGVYSSPHLVHYNERVQIDGNEASDRDLCRAFAAVEAARGEISLTYFEMGTLAAFWLFRQSSLDAVVLEVGLGGRLDAVNLIDADLSLVTSIGVDHVDYLGDTREQVAFEKAGIFRQGTPALCGDLDPPQPLLDKVSELPNWLARSSCAGAISTWRALTHIGNGVVPRSGARRWSWSICPSSTCRWRTQPWQCRRTC